MKRPDFTGVKPEVAEYITTLENRIDDITQMLQNLQRLYFGRKSEKIRVPAAEDGNVQLSIFDDEIPSPVPQPVEPVESATIEVAGHKRKKKRTQEEIVANLPVFIHEYALAPEALRCPRCGNEQLTYIGRELAYTEYERIPAHIDKHEYYVAKYACHACEDGSEKCASCANAGTEICNDCFNKPGMMVIAAELPEKYRHPLIKGSKASASIVSQVMYDKFVLGLPEYRQEEEWKRLGFPLSRQTMSNWILRVDKDYLRALTAHMLKTVKTDSSVVHCDETPVKVLDEKTDDNNVKKCHMWVVRTGKHEKRQLVVFSYRATRSGSVATDILNGYNRYFVSDGYAGYNGLGQTATRCGCWAHVRRKFYDSVPDHNMELPGAARDAVRYCDRLFRIEEKLENVTPEERLNARKQESLPIVEEFYTWLDTLRPALKKLREAIAYAKNRKQDLVRFLEDGRIPLSNNAAENAIRPFVVGRKNWLFCKSNDGAIAAADAYSMVETAKANRLDVLKYLNYIFQHAPLADGCFDEQFLDSLMPWNEHVLDACRCGDI